MSFPALYLIHFQKMATQMAFYPPAANGMNQSPFQSRHATGPSQGPASIGNNSFIGAGLPRVVPGGDPMRPPIPPGRHMFHPFNRPYPKPGQDRSDYDSKQLRKSSMRKTVDYYSSVIRMLEVNESGKYKDLPFNLLFTNVYYSFYISFLNTIFIYMVLSSFGF